MLYFSYGSNMSSKRLLQRVPSARFVTVATLLKHQLKFHKSSKNDGSAKCNIAENGNLDSFVIGVVFNISESEKPVLDRVEGLNFGYNLKQVNLFSILGESLTAFTYYATDIDSTLKPFHWYKNHVIKGAEEFNLPRHYIEKIINVESIDDNNQKRCAIESAIYD